MVNKNTVSQVAKLLMQPQFQISPLQFFRNVSFLSCSSYCCFIYFLYLFSLCLAGFTPPPPLSFFSVSGSCRGRVVFFSTFHLSHLVKCSALISSLWYGVRRIRNNCQVQIKNGWSGCNIELLNTSRDLSDGYGTRFSSHSLLPLPLSPPGGSSL